MPQQCPLPFSLELHFHGTDCLQFLEDLESHPASAQFHNDIAHIRRFIIAAKQMARINYLATRGGDQHHKRKAERQGTPVTL